MVKKLPYNFIVNVNRNPVTLDTIVKTLLSWYSLSMTKHIENKNSTEVKIVDATTIIIDGHKYEIVSPCESMYDDKEYIDWNDAYWVKI